MLTLLHKTNYIIYFSYLGHCIKIKHGDTLHRDLEQRYCLLVRVTSLSTIFQLY